MIHANLHIGVGKEHVLVERGDGNFENAKRMLDSRDEQILGRLEPGGERDQDRGLVLITPSDRLLKK